MSNITCGSEQCLSSTCGEEGVALVNPQILSFSFGVLNLLEVAEQQNDIISKMTFPLLLMYFCRTLNSHCKENLEHLNNSFFLLK